MFSWHCCDFLVTNLNNMLIIIYKIYIAPNINHKVALRRFYAAIALVIVLCWITCSLIVFGNWPGLVHSSYWLSGYFPQCGRSNWKCSISRQSWIVAAAITSHVLGGKYFPSVLSSTDASALCRPRSWSTQSWTVPFQTEHHSTGHHQSWPNSKW